MTQGRVVSHSTQVLQGLRSFCVNWVRRLCCEMFLMRMFGCRIFMVNWFCGVTCCCPASCVNWLSDQDKTSAMQWQSLSPDKGDSVWKRRTRIPGKHVMLADTPFLLYALERLSPHCCGSLAWKRFNANSLALAMFLYLHDTPPHCAV